LRISAAHNEAGSLKNIEVLGDSRLAQIKRLHEFRYVRVSQRQTSEDRASRGVRERSEGQAQRVLFTHRLTDILPYGNVLVKCFDRLELDHHAA